MTIRHRIQWLAVFLARLVLVPVNITRSLIYWCVRKAAWKSLLPDVLVVIALCMLVIGLHKSIEIWRTNEAANKQAALLVRIANTKAKNSPYNLQPLPNNQVPSTVQPLVTQAIIPDYPKTIIIPSIAVNSPIISVGLTADGAVGTPSNVYEAAWYNQSALPGQPGAVLIDGHISSWTTHGIFYNLHTLVPGDLIQIQLGNGQIVNYRVLRTAIYGANDVDMNTILNPIDATSHGLNLVSCYGEVISGTSEFNERIVVFASEV